MQKRWIMSQNFSFGDNKLYFYFFKSRTMENFNFNCIFPPYRSVHVILTQPEQKILEDLEVVITEV